MKRLKFSIPPGFWTFIGAIVIAWVSNYLTINSQQTVSNSQKRQQIYSKLRSLEFPAKQLYVSRGEAIIFSDYYERVSQLEKVSSNSFSFQEAVRHGRRAEDFTKDIMQLHENLSMTLGEIESLFELDEEGEKLLSRARTHGLWAAPPSSKIMNIKDLQTWKSETVRMLQEYAANEYGKPILDLAAYIKPQLK